MPMRTVDVKNASSGIGHSEVKCTAVFSELTGTEARNFSISRQAAYALLYLKNGSYTSQIRSQMSVIFF